MYHARRRNFLLQDEPWSPSKDCRLLILLIFLGSGSALVWFLMSSLAAVAPSGPNSLTDCVDFRVVEKNPSAAPFHLNASSDVSFNNSSLPIVDVNIRCGNDSHPAPHHLEILVFRKDGTIINVVPMLRGEVTVSVPLLHGVHPRDMLGFDVAVYNPLRVGKSGTRRMEASTGKSFPYYELNGTVRPLYFVFDCFLYS